MTTIREARRSLGVTQRELARRLGVSVATVSQTETRETHGDVTLRTRTRYLNALGLEDLGMVTPRAAPTTVGTRLPPAVTTISASSPAASSRSRRRSLILHRLVDTSVNWDDTSSWLDIVRTGITRNRQVNHGHVHQANTERWAAWLEAGDVATMRERMCAEDEDGCQLREVSPLAGLLTTAQRQAVISWEREHHAA